MGLKSFKPPSVLNSFNSAILDFFQPEFLNSTPKDFFNNNARLGNIWRKITIQQILLGCLKDKVSILIKRNLQHLY